MIQTDETVKRMTVTPTVSPVTETNIRAGLPHSVALAVLCLAAYELTTQILGRVHSISTSDDLLGGMWAVIAAVFVYRTSYQESVTAAWSRSVATLLSFVLCFVYLLIAPFHAWALAALIGLGALVLTVVGRPGDVATAAITTAVVMVAAAISPHDAWQQPILRLADTAIGVAIGLAAAGATLYLSTRQQP
jgi:hypothetical protein